jgi:quercetin dioxygenase-like cupin family protein
MTPEPEIAVRGVLVRPGEGEVVTDRDDRDIVLLVEREDITITRSRYAPGAWGPDPHVHHEQVDAWYVLGGELTFVLGAEDRRVRAPAGSFVGVPPNVVHSFGNESPTETSFPQPAYAGRGLRGLHARPPRRARRAV